MFLVQWKKQDGEMDAKMVQYFSEKSMAQYLCMGRILPAAVLFHLPDMVSSRNFSRHRVISAFLHLLFLFIQIEKRPRLYVGQLRNRHQYHHDAIIRLRVPIDFYSVFHREY